jgi:hypothetical protein
MMTVSLLGKRAAGRVAIVDDDDFELVSQFPWRIFEIERPGARSTGPYAQMGPKPHLMMHKLLLPGESWVDHINHDGLDNRRINLRPITNLQNQHNRRPNLRAVSPYKGVTWDPDNRRWCARIKIDKRDRRLGRYRVEADAARAYDAAALAAFGEYAYLNFP